MTDPRSTARAGALYGAVAYGLWGLVPLYFNTVRDCTPWELVAHRILWSALLLTLVTTAFRRWSKTRAAFANRRMVLMLFASAVLVAGNWVVYVYSATSGQVTQASLGYFILPLVNAVAGVLLFHERIRAPQVIALTIAGLGVLYMAVRLGMFPWIGLTLAGSFALYGIVRKIVPVDGVTGLTVETYLLSPIAIVFLIVWSATVGMTFGHLDRRLDIMIALSGVVTTLPLVCFAQAVRKVSLVTLGVLQYMSPSFQLIVAITVNDEPFTPDHQVSFGLIWSGLFIYAVDSVRHATTRARNVHVEDDVPEPIDGGLPLTDGESEK